MAAVDVIIPWLGGCEHRYRALSWVLRRYEEHPDWRVTVAPLESGPWVKAHAVTRGLEQTDAPIVVVADADVWCDGTQLAIDALEGAPWAIPHKRVKRLSAASTEKVYGGEIPDWLELEEPAYEGAPGGGIVVLPRQTALDIPLDPRFVGYGNEDRAWGKALWILAGRPWRGSVNLFHLWHPPQERPDRNHGSPESEALRQRYNAAENHEAPMRALLDEIPR